MIDLGLPLFLPTQETIFDLTLYMQVQLLTPVFGFTQRYQNPMSVPLPVLIDSLPW